MIMILISLMGAAVLLAADQLIKWWARASLAGAEPIVVIEEILELVYVENRGAAWGILQGKRWILLLITSVVLVLLLCYLIMGKAAHPVEAFSISLVLSGGAGNLIDRLFFGYVTDYIYFKPINFPVFNLADICVVVGTILFCFYWVVMDSRLRTPTIQAEPPSDVEGGAQNGTEH